MTRRKPYSGRRKSTVIKSGGPKKRAAVALELIIDRLLDAQETLTKAAEDAEVFRWEVEDSDEMPDIDAAYLASDIEDVRDNNIEGLLEHVRELLEELDAS